VSDSRVYLVTGASGFVGRALCRRLRGKGRVRGLFRSPAQGPWDEAVLADISTGAAPREAFDGVDTVFHLAAKTDDGRVPPGDEGLFHRVNTEGTARILDASAAAGVARFVFASSIKAMGHSGGEPADETVSARPSTPYGKSKKAAEDLVLADSRLPHACVVRATPVYGPGSKGNVSRMIRAMARGVFPAPPDTRNARSMIHVDDLARALDLCADHEAAAGRLFIVSDGRVYSTRQIYEWVRASMGKGQPVWSVPASVLRAAGKVGDALGVVAGKPLPLNGGLVERLLGSACYDSSLIRRTLGFAPEWDLERSLPAIVRGLPQSGSGESR
jgi:UDP-glucose 4-epimerase